MNIVSYGAGTNSTALLIEMVNRGIPVDLITFADTGAERPQTYEYLKMFSDWLVTKGYPEIITLRAETPSKIGGIEQFCLTHKTLPSIAFGYKKCSQQFKGDPQDKFIKNHPMVKEVWARGEKVNKYIGYDADEPHSPRLPCLFRSRASPCLCGSVRNGSYDRTYSSLAEPRSGAVQWNAWLCPVGTILPPSSIEP